jgi:8-oxo-dGTP pyrophosphatase MutT (NUDIX family)
MHKDNPIEVLVRGVYVVRGHLLVCQSKGAANTYLPGGHVEFRERAAAGLAREIKEELGVRAVVGRFLGAVEHTFRQQGQRHCEVNLVFQMTLPALQPDREPPALEHWIGFTWVPLSRIRTVHLEPWPLRTLIPGWLRARTGVARWGSTV